MLLADEALIAMRLKTFLLVPTLVGRAQDEQSMSLLTADELALIFLCWCQRGRFNATFACDCEYDRLCHQ
jgi:hypothetical protein